MLHGTGILFEPYPHTTNAHENEFPGLLAFHTSRADIDSIPKDTRKPAGTHKTPSFRYSAGRKDHPQAQ
jgi:hypothetical protein